MCAHKGKKNKEDKIRNVMKIDKIKKKFFYNVLRHPEYWTNDDKYEQSV